jgi:hypothetical protein
MIPRANEMPLSPAAHLIPVVVLTVISVVRAVSAIVGVPTPLIAVCIVARPVLIIPTAIAVLIILTAVAARLLRVGGLRILTVLVHAPLRVLATRLPLSVLREGGTVEGEEQRQRGNYSVFHCLAPVVPGLNALRGSKVIAERIQIGIGAVATGSQTARKSSKYPLAGSVFAKGHGQRLLNN